MKYENKGWLPEVGEECEFEHGKRGWMACKIIAIDYVKNRVIAEDVEFDSNHEFDTCAYFYRDLPLRPNDFRPIKSQSDIDRKEAIEGVNKVLIPFHYLTDSNLADIRDAILEAGYRKVDEKVTKDEVYEVYRAWWSSGGSEGPLDTFIYNNFDIYKKVG